MLIRFLINQSTLMELSVFLVVRGNIRSVETDSNFKAAVIKVSATRVYRQKFALFPDSGRLTRSGEIRTPLQCGVRPGAGSFLFTGRVHFGEAWLGCAPRYKDFLKAYEQAKQSLMIPCTLVNDWRKKHDRVRPKLDGPLILIRRVWDETPKRKNDESLGEQRKRHWDRNNQGGILSEDHWIKMFWLRGYRVSHSTALTLIPGSRTGPHFTLRKFDMNIISLKYPKSSWCLGTNSCGRSW